MNEFPDATTSYRRVVFCFLDILGYKDWIQQLGQDGPKTIKNIFDSVIRDHKDLYRTVSFKILSDSVLIWSAGAEPVDFWRVTNIVQLVSDAFLGKGRMVRGGISVGDSYINGDIIVSPALIEAYRLEQKAKVSRIIITEEAHNLGFNQIIKNNEISYLDVTENGKKYARLVMPGTISIDFDKEMCILPFCGRTGMSMITDGVDPGTLPGDRPSVQYDWTEQAVANLSNVRKELSAIAQMATDKSVIRDKLNYLIDKFNSFVAHEAIVGRVEKLNLLE